MLADEQIVTFDDVPPPPGRNPWVKGQQPSRDVAVVTADRSWPRVYAQLAEWIREGLSDKALRIDHVGSTAVPDLAAKPVIDIDLVVKDSRDEAAYVPLLERYGFVLVVREPWWYEHRCLRHSDPACNLHVFFPDCPETERHRIFRDWLCAHPGERALYQSAKLAAADETSAADGHAMDYNRRKQRVLREIYKRAFHSHGLTADAARSRD